MSTFTRRALSRLAAGAVAGALLACTATPTTAEGGLPEPAPSAPTVVRVLQPYTPVGVVLTSTPTLLPTPSRHSAFPGLVQHPDGHLSAVWRGASGHEAERDGAVMRAESYNLGKTWATPTVMLDTPKDERDPYLTVIDGHEYLTFFTGSRTLAAEGAYVSRDGAPAVRIDQLPYAAVSGPVVKLPDGRLGVAYYGRKAGESVDTAWMAWSADGGATWSSNRIVNAGISTAEPWLVVDGSTVHLFARWGGDKIAVRSTPDSGITWGGARVIIDGCTGRPSTMRTQDGTLIMICRGPVSQGNHAKLLYSLDHGGYWIVGPTVLTAAPGALGMTYAAMVEVLPGVVHAVVGLERADGSSVLYGMYLAVSVR